MAPAQDLPAELLLTIFEHAVNRSSSSVDIEMIVFPDTHLPLLSFGLVCRRWSRLAQRVLYRDLVISRADCQRDGSPAPGRGAAMRKLMETLADNAMLARWVDFFHVDVGRPAHAAPKQIGLLEDVRLSDVAQLAALCPRVRHVSLTLESTPAGAGACFTDEELASLAAAAGTVRALTFTDFRPILSSPALVANDAAQPGNELLDSGVDGRSMPAAPASNDVLVQCLSAWPSVALLSTCCSSPPAGPDTADVEDRRVTLPALREVRGYGCGGLPFVDAPNVDRLEWVRLPDDYSILSGTLTSLVLWELNVAVNLSSLESLQHVSLDIRDAAAWDTLDMLPSAVEGLVLYAPFDKDTGERVVRVIGTLRNLRRLVVMTYANHRTKQEACPLDDISKACNSSSVELVLDFEHATAPWDVIQRLR